MSDTTLRLPLLPGAKQGPLTARACGYWRTVGRRLSRDYVTLFFALVISIIALAAVLAPLVAPYDPNATSMIHRLKPIGYKSFILGTDELGRDIYGRLLFGSRITLYIACLTATIAAPLGLLVGTTAGYVGGVVDIVLMRIVDVFLAFPSLILALAFVAALGPGIENAIIAISFAAWPPIARLARAETLSIRKSDYIAAVRLQGASPLRIILRHVVPMCIPSVVVRITLNMATIILAAAGLGFLGLGAQPPSPEWGAMLASAREFIMTNGWIAAIPGSAILIVSLAFNLFGDGLRDILDPRHG